MTANEFVNQVEKASTNTILIEPPSGSGRAFFEKVLAYYSSSPAKLKRLIPLWSQLIDVVDDPAWVWRAAGVLGRIQGQWLNSAECFERAGRAAKTPAERASFPVGAIDGLARAGKLEEAEALAKRTYSKLMKLGEAGLASRALFNLGNALVYQDRMAEARKALLKALPGLEDSGYRIEAASARMALSSTYLFDGDPRRAIQLAQLAIDEATELSADYLCDLADLNIALANVVMNNLEDAFDRLRALENRLSDSPLDRSRVQEYLGDTYFKLNLWSEALASYRSALRGSKIPVHRGHLLMGMAEAHVQLGEKELAKKAFIRARRIYRTAGANGWLALCMISLAKLERLPKVRFDQLRSLTKDSTFHYVHVLLFECESGLDRTNEALRIIRRNGYFDLEWQIHYIRATQSTSPGSHFRAAFRSIQVRRLAFSSLTARSNYLRDKLSAINAYIDWLLANPSPKKIREVRDVIMQIRSITLLDEVLARNSLPASLAKLLAEARSSLTFETQSSRPEGTRRGLSNLFSARFQQVATRALMEVNVANSVLPAQSDSTLMIAETENRVFAIGANTVTAFAIDQARLVRLLKWLQYEILAPMADKKANDKMLAPLLKELALGFGSGLTASTKSVCPDRFTWQIPWTLMAQSVGIETELALSLHPSLVGRPHSLEGKQNLVFLGIAEDLHHAEAEALIVSQHLGGCEIIRSAAEARSALNRDVGILHVVGHAHHENHCPSLSSIQFPDGPLFAFEIARSSLLVEIATLSACDTGAVSLASQTEPDGLARAFIGRGAAWAVGNLWPLDDEAGLKLFDTFYKHFQQENDVIKAISHAKCITRMWNSHPYFWGGLTAYAGLNI